MKKFLSILLMLFLVMGTAGSAVAAFDNNGTFLVAYEEDESLVIQGINDQPGLENYFDLGNTANFVDFVDTLTPGEFVDTNITLDDFASADDFGDVFVGIMGKTDPSSFDYFFSADGAYDFYASDEGGFGNAHFAVMNRLTSGPNAQIDKTSDPNYRIAAQQSGDNPGSYGGPVRNAGNFGAEVNLAGISATNPITVGYYGGDVFVDFIDPDGDFIGQFPLIGQLDLWLDTDGSILLGDFQAVPVPAAVYLLGSGMLALVGIRRRKS